MSEKLLIPLDVMPPELRHAIETILKKHQALARNPSAANSSSLDKPYEALKNLWEELQWKPYLNGLQQQEMNLVQQRAAKPTIVQRKLQQARNRFAKSLEQRKQTLEQRKLALRNSMIATKQQLAEKLRRLNRPSQALIAEQLRSYANEWTNAEARIKQQKARLRQADNNYPNVLVQHKNALQAAFNQKQYDLQQQQRQLSGLQQQNAERRSAWPGWLTTYEQEVNAKWDEYNGYCLSLRPPNANVPDLACWQTSLTSILTDLLSWEEHLSERRQRLEDW